jgi:hypothetical protein
MTTVLKISPLIMIRNGLHKMLKLKVNYAQLHIDTFSSLAGLQGGEEDILTQRIPGVILSSKG